MASALYPIRVSVSVVTNSNTFFFIGASCIRASSSGTEANRQTRFRTAGLLSNVSYQVITNDRPGTSTIKVRKGGVDTALVVSVPATTTGTFSENSLSVAVAAGDLIAGQLVAGGGGVNTIAFRTGHIVFTPDNASETVTKFGSTGAGETFVVAFFPCPIDGTNMITTENQLQLRVAAGTLRNAGIFVNGNTRDAITNWTIRKNGVDQTLTLAVAAGTTGWFEDTTHTVTVVDGDLINWRYDHAGTSGVVAVNGLLQFEFVSTAGVWLGATGSGPTTQGSDTTRYFYPGGQKTFETLEADTQQPPTPLNIFWSKFSVFINLNNISGGNSTFRSRVDGANGSVVITVPSSTTGRFSDLTGRKRVNANSSFDVQGVTNTGGVNGLQSCIFSWQATIAGPDVPPPPPVVPSVSVPVVLIDLVNGTDFPFDGTAFSLPAHITRITWQTSMQVAPASIQIDLQISLDGTNWATLDSSTSTSGEVRSKKFSAQYIRANGVAASGGTGISAKLVAYKERLH